MCFPLRQIVDKLFGTAPHPEDTEEYNFAGQVLSPSQVTAAERTRLNEEVELIPEIIRLIDAEMASGKAICSVYSDGTATGEYRVRLANPVPSAAVMLKVGAIYRRAGWHVSTSTGVIMLSKHKFTYDW